MLDIDEIQKRAQQAKERAAAFMKNSLERNEELIQNLSSSEPDEKTDAADSEAEEQSPAGTERQVEILGQIFQADGMAQLFGEDMGILAAALETLALEDADEGEDIPFDLELEERLYMTLEEIMARIDALPEPEPVPYQKNDGRWERFGILLSGILSALNDHHLDRMDVEEHIPVMEQKIVSLVRRSWGIDGRSGLLDMIRYLSQEGYTLRYQLYSEASSPEELTDETMDEEDCASVSRAWRFAQRYKSQYSPDFMAGWDTGRAAMLARWGCYLGWLTESEAVGILWDLSQKAAERLHSWREFAQSYLFGGLMWKLLCGDNSAGSYLGYLADAATDLLTGKTEEGHGQWRNCPWPEQRRIGFKP